jgi:hypothetical protein
MNSNNLDKNINFISKDGETFEGQKECVDSFKSRKNFQDSIYFDDFLSIIGKIEAETNSMYQINIESFDNASKQLVIGEFCERNIDKPIKIFFMKENYACLKGIYSNQDDFKRKLSEMIISEKIDIIASDCENPELIYGKCKECKKYINIPIKILVGNKYFYEGIGRNKTSSEFKFFCDCGNSYMSSDWSHIKI